MKNSKRSLGIFAGVIVVVAAIALLAYPAINRYFRTFEVRGVVTYVDPATRQAAFEFAHPKNGHIIEIMSEVPDECPVLVNGEPGKLTDVHPGDQARVKALWTKKTQKILAVSVSPEGGAPPK